MKFLETTVKLKSSVAEEVGDNGSNKFLYSNANEDDEALDDDDDDEEEEEEDFEGVEKMPSSKFCEAVEEVVEVVAVDGELEREDGEERGRVGF